MTLEELYALTPEDVSIFNNNERYHIRRRSEGNRYPWEILHVERTDEHWSGMREAWFLDTSWVVDKPLDCITVSVCSICTGRFVQKAGEHRQNRCALCANVAA